MSKMGYEGKGLGKHSKGIFEPIMVEERTKYLGLGYGQTYGESSKASMKAIETVPKRSFIADPLCQARLAQKLMSANQLDNIIHSTIVIYTCTETDQFIF